jgi:uncharacterized protein YbjT (DUF2867 family)
MILVTTAGQVGAEAVRILAQQGTPVRVLVRNPSRAVRLAAAGADVVVGDLDLPATIDQAMDGVTAVVLVSPAIVTQELNVVASAARAGVSHIVKASSKASADSPIARRRGQIEIETGLTASGLPHTILRSNAYMQNLLALAPAISRTNGFASATGSGRVGLVDARDVAASPAGHAGQTYLLTGPDRLSYYDVAATFSALLGRAITYREVSPEDNRDAMIRAGVPEPVAIMNAQAFGLIAQGDADWLSNDIESVLGRAPRSFATFVADHAQTFS